jgi:hypothetical protein
MSSSTPLHRHDMIINPNSMCKFPTKKFFLLYFCDLLALATSQDYMRDVFPNLFHSTLLSSLGLESGVF